MQDQVIETVTFELNDNVTDQAFLTANLAVETFLEECPGFLSRRLSKGSDGTWLDYLEWRDMDSANAAAQRLPTEEKLRPFMASIKEGTAKMAHRQLALAVG